MMRIYDYKLALNVKSLPIFCCDGEVFQLVAQVLHRSAEVSHAMPAGERLFNDYSRYIL